MVLERGIKFKKSLNYNRYLVISGLPDRMMNCKTIRSEFDWTLEDGASAVLSIELHTMMSKDVAHLSMRDVTAAQTLKAFCEEKVQQSIAAAMDRSAHHHNSTIGVYTNVRAAHAGPRKAGRIFFISISLTL